MQQTDLVYRILGCEQNERERSDTEGAIIQFQGSTGFILPNDLAYFFSIAGSAERQYNEEMYRFLSVNGFRRIDKELSDFKGTPDYSNIVSTLTEYKECFLFADYMVCMFSYAIRLSENESVANDIYIICGDKYKIIANSFTEFLHLYLSGSAKLQFEY